LPSACRRLEGGATPADHNLGTAAIEVRKLQLGARTLQQRLSDEDPETHVLALAISRRHVWLAQAFEQSARKSWTIVADCNDNVTFAPPGDNVDPVGRELNRVLHEIP
jgi:hypothetical protein